MSTDFDLTQLTVADSATWVQALVTEVKRLRAMEADALRFRKLTTMLQAAYDGDDAVADRSDELKSVYCTMLSGWRNTRVVKAEITWRDERDTELDLASALDKINL